MTASFWECQNAKKNYFHLAGLATSGQVAKHVRADAPAVNHAVSFSSMPPTQEPSRPHNSQFAVICLLLSLFLVFYQRFDTFLINRTVAHKFVVLQCKVAGTAIKIVFATKATSTITPLTLASAGNSIHHYFASKLRPKNIKSHQSS